MLNTFLPQEEVAAAPAALMPTVGGAGGGAIESGATGGRPEWIAADWSLAELRDDVRGLLRLPAGAELASAVAALPRGPVCPVPHVAEAGFAGPRPGHESGFPCACQVVMAAAWEACAAWVAAGAAQALVDSVGPVPVIQQSPFGVKIADPAREELAVALRVSAGSMGNRISIARALVGQPELHALVSAGAISAWAGRLVLDQVAALAPEQATAVIEAVVGRIRKRLASGRVPWTSAEINQCARGVRMRLFPHAEATVRARALADRQVTVHAHGNGMATLAAVLAETDAVRIHRRLSALAAGMQREAQGCGEADTRTRDQIRADLLVDLLLSGRALRVPSRTGANPGGVGTTNAGEASDAAGIDGGRDDHGPGTPGRDGEDSGRLLAIPPADRPEINLIVRLETLLGLAEDPGQVPGLGAIPAELARELAADGRWRAWIVDASGAVTAAGATGYLPTAAIARLVRARHPRCRFPGCRQAAASCDLDHAIPYPTGPTTPENLGPLCRRHHNLKTHGGWDLEPEPASQGAGEGGGAGVGWSWRTPAGMLIWDGPEPPDTP